MNRTLTHLTVDTGHSRLSARTEVADDVIAMLAPLLRRALSGERVALPAPDGGYWFAADETGDTLRATIGGPLGPLVSLTVTRGPGSTTWPGPGAEPRGPWCAFDAVRVDLDAVRVDLRAMRWLGDAERCLAWTWLASP